MKSLFATQAHLRRDGTFAERSLQRGGRVRPQFRDRRRGHSARLRNGLEDLTAGSSPGRPLFLLFENSMAVADFDTKAVSKIDQKWRILIRVRSVKLIEP